MENSSIDIVSMVCPFQKQHTFMRPSFVFTFHIVMKLTTISLLTKFPYFL